MNLTEVCYIVTFSNKFIQEPPMINSKIQRINFWALKQAESA